MTAIFGLPSSENLYLPLPQNPDMVIMDSEVIAKAPARFCKQVGLPTTLKDLGLAQVTDDRLLDAAKETCKPDDTMVNMPFPVKPEDIVTAMRKVDEISRGLIV